MDTMITPEGYTIKRGQELCIFNGLRVTREGLMDPFLWKELGFQVVGDAVNWAYNNRSDLLTCPSDVKQNLLFCLSKLSGYWYDELESSLRTAETLKYFRSYFRGKLNTVPRFVVAENQSSGLLFQEGESTYTYTLDTYTLEYCLYPTESLEVEGPAWPSFFYEIHNYTYTPDKTKAMFFRALCKRKGEVFYKDQSDSRFFGVELELSTKLSPKELQMIVTHVHPKQTPFFYMKKDVSVSGKYTNKIELVTVPADPKYLKKAFQIFFGKIEKLCSSKGGVDAWFDTSNALSNGIHIHVSKDSFSSELQQRKFLQFFHSSRPGVEELLKTISKRPDGRRAYYAKIDEQFLGLRETYYLMGKKVLSKNGRNLCCTDGKDTPTLEVRLFQGIFDKTHLLTCIETVEAVKEMVESGVNITEFIKRPAKAFVSFVSKSVEYPNLKGVVK